MKTETDILDAVEDLSAEDVASLRPIIHRQIKETLQNLAHVNVTDRVLANAITDDVCAVLVRNLKGH